MALRRQPADGFQNREEGWGAGARGMGACSGDGHGISVISGRKEYRERLVQYTEELCRLVQGASPRAGLH